MTDARIDGAAAERGVDADRGLGDRLRFAEGRDRSAAGSFAANLAASALSARFGGDA